MKMLKEIAQFACILRLRLKSLLTRLSLMISAAGKKKHLSVFLRMYRAEEELGQTCTDSRMLKSLSAALISTGNGLLSSKNATGSFSKHKISRSMLWCKTICSVTKQVCSGLAQHKNCNLMLS